MHSQVRFVMHPDDEREFEQVLVREESIRFIAGPRWKTATPVTSRSLSEIHNSYCIIWSISDIAKLDAEYIPSAADWYCRSEHATIQFLRSELDGTVLTEGRIAVSTMVSDSFSAVGVERLEQRYKDLRKYFRKSYSNSVIQWRNRTLPYAPAGPNRSANPSPPDAQVWVGPHALRWLREQPDRRIKQLRQGNVEATLAVEAGQSPAE